MALGVARVAPRLDRTEHRGSAANWAAGHIDAQPRTALCERSPDPEISANTAPN
jgi:hypothetical protein